MNNRKHITVITATKNSAAHVNQLVSCIENQSEKNFNWIVIDCLSDDGTLDTIRDCKHENVVINSEMDFGIYDALNKAIRSCKTEYYLVLGSDDYLLENAIKSYYEKIENSSADLITAAVEKGGSTIRPLGGSTLLRKQRAFISTHSVGLVIRKDLHQTYGFYSSRFPIAADQYFLLRAYFGNASIEVIDDVVGTFSKGGVSSLDVIGTLSESYRIQLEFHNKYFVTLVYLLKILKNWRKL